MKNEIIKRNIFITFLTSMIFLVLAFLIMSFQSRKNLKEQLVSISSLVASNIEGLDENDIKVKVNEFTKDQTFITISVSDTTGRIFIDSSNDAIGYETSIYFSSDEIEKSNSSFSDERIYTNGFTFYYIEKVGDVIFRTSTIYKENFTFIITGIFVMLLLMVFEIFLSYVYSKKTSENVLKTFNNIRNTLNDINNGNDTKLELNNSYEEVIPVLKEINKVNSKISDSINKIKQERNKLSLVVNRLDEGIIVLDEKGDLLLLNDLAKKILDINKEYKLPIKHTEVINNDIINKYIIDSYELKNNYFFDYHYKEENKIYFVSVLYTKMKWERDNQRVVFVTFSDVTEDRFSSKIKSNFISNASHELKTPITSIIGFSELLKQSKESLDPKQEKYIERIHSESTRMKELIEDLIYLSNLEYREKEEQDYKEKIYFKDEVESIVARLEANNPRNIKFNILCDDSYVYASMIDISRLLSNLIENAFKYNKDNGEITIKVNEHTNFIILEVIDTGIGIDASEISRIFERFYRVDKSRGGEVSGTGLGLNIVKEICDNLNAKIKVESKIGEGTNFRITFNKGE